MESKRVSHYQWNMVRLGLCCSFRDEPIRFGNTTLTAVAKMPRKQAIAKLSSLCLANAESLLLALDFCHRNGIGSFRIVSQILPIKSHPVHGYRIDELPDAVAIVAKFEECGRLARKHNIRTGFHPDQFVVLNSPKSEVVAASIRELDYQAEVAEWVNADTINIHGGGAYGDKVKSLDVFERALDTLPDRVRTRLTVENDDKIYSPAELLPICERASLPLVYDAHHHRCLKDDLSIEEATKRAMKTWSREPLFHLSSPLEGWSGPKPERHHDFIDVSDFPACWRKQPLTVEVEAKAKEAAVLKLKQDLTAAKKKA